MTTIILIIICVLVIGLGIWSWWFENGKADESEETVGEENKASELEDKNKEREE